MQTIAGKRPTTGDSFPLLAGAAVGVAGVGLALALADVSSQLRAPFTLFFLIAAPAAAVGAALRGLDPMSRVVVAAAAATGIDLLVAQLMLALHIWSVRGGVLAVAVLSAVCFLPATVRRRRAGDARSRAS
ncbi:hypothetical protein [Streptomyces sp. H27-D2]|uniref:hypothetical protein n=1 Tax=Streptomyces sp. H27-D2 TaxID=3046304 RepID=UPI002DB9CB5E|nr:hypothetical protein [Streptomyces sp. H27-D2]MEC4018540.1 hypothetical protein [Streptomyces sp. H27-D2]